MKRHVEERKGYRIIRRGDFESDMSPLSCPICNCIVIDELDTLAISRSKACLDCEREVIDPNRLKWIEGWRPSEGEILSIKVARLSSPHSRKYI